MPSKNVTKPQRLRPRRLRRTPVLRDLVAETDVAARRLIMPHFVLPSARGEEPIASMPGIAQLGVENLVRAVEADLALGIKSILLFGHPEAGGKTPDGAAAAAANGAVQKAVRALKKAFGDSLTARQLQQVLRYRNRKGEVWEYALWRMLYHLCNHSTYHRGQAVTQLRQLGATPPSTDLVAFLWETPASGGA